MRKLMMAFAVAVVAVAVQATDWMVKDNVTLQVTSAGTLTADAPVVHSFPEELKANVLYSFDSQNTAGWEFVTEGGKTLVKKIPSSIDNGAHRYLVSDDAERNTTVCVCDWIGKPYFDATVSTLAGFPVVDFGKYQSRKLMLFNQVADGSKWLKDKGPVNVLSGFQTVIAVYNSADGGGYFLGGGYGSSSYNTSTPRDCQGYEYLRGDLLRTASGAPHYSDAIVKHPASWDLIWGWMYHDGLVSWPGMTGFNGGWEVLSAVFRDKDACYGIGCGDTRAVGSACSGMKVAEIYFFDKKLTDAERGAVENYLQNKWFGRSQRGWDGNAVVGTLRPYIDGVAESKVDLTANVGAGEKASVGELKGGRWNSSFAKTGAGTLSVDTAEHLGLGLTLAAGTLEFPRETTEGTALPGGDILLHFDASDMSSLSTVQVGEETYVAGWKNLGNQTFRGVAADKLVAKAPTDAARPILRADALGTGKAVLDFGDYGSGRYLEFRSSADDAVMDVRGLQTVFAVVDPTHSGGHLLGYTKGASVNGLSRDNPTWATKNDFHQPMWTLSPKNPSGSDITLRHQVMSGTNGFTYVDGKRIDPSRGYPHPGWQVVAVQTMGDFASAIGRTYADAKGGGLQIAELVAYNRVLTDKEMADAQAYLAAKWTKKSVAGFARFAADGRTNLRTLHVAGASTVSVSGTGSARIGKVTGSAALTKSGSGTLEVAQTDGNTDLTVASGTVKIVAANDVSSDSEIAPDAAFHVDASDDSSFLFYEADGKKYVSQWRDTDRPTDGIVAFMFDLGRMPWRLTEGDDLCNGKPVVDFGPMGEANGGRMMTWTESLDSIRSAFVVLKPKGGYTCPLGTTELPSDGGGKSYDYMASSANTPVHYSMATAMYWDDRGGSIYRNGEKLDPQTSAWIGGYQLLEFHPGSGTHASGFACDRVSRTLGEFQASRGGQWLAEVVVYDRVLSEREKLATRNYLMNKWGLAGTPAAVPPKVEDMVSFKKVIGSAGASFDTAKPVTVKELAGDIALTGSGKVMVDDLNATDGKVSVVSGTLAVATALAVPAANPSVPADGKIIHFDASVGVTTENVEQYDGKRITRWAPSVGTVYAAPHEENGCPVLVASGPNGLPYVHMHGRSWTTGGYDNSLRFFDANGNRVNVGGMKTIFWVLGAPLGGGNLLGGGTKYQKTGNNFYRGIGASGMHGYSSAAHAADPLLEPTLAQTALLTANWHVNAKKVDPTTDGLEPSWNVISMSFVDAADSTDAGGFAYNAGYPASQWEKEPTGWQDLAEVIAYDRILSDGERRQVETYLARKWGLGCYSAGDGSKLSVELAEGATLDLAGGELAPGEIKGSGTVANGALVPTQLVADFAATEWVEADEIIVNEGMTVFLKNVPATVEANTLIRICAANRVEGKLRNVTFDAAPDGFKPRLVFKDGWLCVMMRPGGLFIVVR